MLVVPMFFCRYLCPMGAVFDPFSRIGLIRVTRDPSKCTACGVAPGLVCMTSPCRTSGPFGIGTAPTAWSAWTPVPKRTCSNFEPDYRRNHAPAKAHNPIAGIPGFDGRVRSASQLHATDHGADLRRGRPARRRHSSWTACGAREQRCSFRRCTRDIPGIFGIETFAGERTAVFTYDPKSNHA